VPDTVKADSYGDAIYGKRDTTPTGGFERVMLALIMDREGKPMRMTSNTCRNCGGILVDELQETLEGTERPPWLEYDGMKHFIRCKQCSATNILMISDDPDGTPVCTISRAIMEDD